MKQLANLIAASTILTLISIVAPAQGNSRVYIMKKDGKLTEVMNGTRSAVTQDVILPNHATVHPDGTVDDIDGNKRQLTEGDYISFVDGRIRKLSSTASPSASTATATATTTKSTATATSKPVKSAPTKKSTGNR